MGYASPFNAIFQALLIEELEKSQGTKINIGKVYREAFDYCKKYFLLDGAVTGVGEKGEEGEEGLKRTRNK